jgi:hypothetical protein
MTLYMYQASYTAKSMAAPLMLVRSKLATVNTAV